VTSIDADYIGFHNFLLEDRQPGDEFQVSIIPEGDPMRTGRPAGFYWGIPSREPDRLTGPFRTAERAYLDAMKDAPQQ